VEAEAGSGSGSGNTLEERSWKRKRTRKYLTFWEAGSGIIFYKTWGKYAKAVKFLWKRKQIRKRIALYGAGSGSKKYSTASTSLAKMLHFSTKTYNNGKVSKVFRQNFSSCLKTDNLVINPKYRQVLGEPQTPLPPAAGCLVSRPSLGFND